jgi:uncharacterized protein (TIGR02300 family)
VAKPNWGTKRTCQSCGNRFYDLGREQIACPKCGAEFDPEAVLKTRRAKPAAAVKPVPAPAPVEPDVEDIEPIEEEAVDGDEKEEDEVIEDTSELGEDTEDVAEVVDKVEDEER